LIAFLLAKYVGLGLTSSRALLLAALLGPVSYGILGTLVLAQQNLSYLALGAREGLTVKLAQATNDKERVLLICSSTLFWAWCVSTLILCGSFLLVFVGGKGNVNWVWVGVISYLSVINEILVNINRDRNKLFRVAATELIYNAVPLGTALILMRHITVTAALMAIAAGLFLSVLMYVSDASEYCWNRVSGRVTSEVLFTGIQLGLVSFVATSLTSVFIFAANVMRLGKTIGLLVFANSFCTIVLYGLNMVAWAATSKIMKSIHATSVAGGLGDRGTSLRAVFRLGVVLCVGAILSLKFIFRFVLQPYAGSEIFAVYACLMQSYALLLNLELNFLAVRSRSLLIAAAYGSVLFVTVTAAFVVRDISITLLMQLSLALLGTFSLCCVYYCRRVGFIDQDFAAQIGFLCFPLFLGVTFALLGTGGAAIVIVAYCVLWVKTDGSRMRAGRAGVSI
jgi:hypothetical protein